MYCYRSSKTNCQTLNMPKAKQRNRKITAVKVKNLRTEEWPSGRACLIAKELGETFRPKDVFSKAEQKTKVGQLKYKKGQNPDDVSTAISSLEVEYRNHLSEDDKIVIVVSAMGSIYGETIVNEMERLGKEVTCDAIVKKLCKVHRATGSGKNTGEDSQSVHNFS